MSKKSDPNPPELFQQLNKLQGYLHFMKAQPLSILLVALGLAIFLYIVLPGLSNSIYAWLESTISGIIWHPDIYIVFNRIYVPKAGDFNFSAQTIVDIYDGQHSYFYVFSNPYNVSSSQPFDIYLPTPTALGEDLNRTDYILTVYNRGNINAKETKIKIQFDKQITFNTTPSDVEISQGSGGLSNEYTITIHQLEAGNYSRFKITSNDLSNITTNDIYVNDEKIPAERVFILDSILMPRIPQISYGGCQVLIPDLSINGEKTFEILMINYTNCDYHWQRLNMS